MVLLIRFLFFYCIIWDKDPNSWLEVRSVLPLLTQKKYYKTLRYGYARGSEPVRYVDGISEYAQILGQAVK